MYTQGEENDVHTKYVLHNNIYPTMATHSQLPTIPPHNVLSHCVLSVVTMSYMSVADSETGEGGTVTCHVIACVHSTAASRRIHPTSCDLACCAE